MNFTLSRHAEHRCQTRGFSERSIARIAEHATETDFGLYFGRREASLAIAALKREIRELERLKDSALICNEGHVITVYKRRRLRSRRRRGK